MTSNQYVWVGDIFPTVCAAVGVTPLNTKPFDGANIWPQLQSITAATPNGGARGVPLVTGAAAGPVAFDTFTDPVNGGSKVFKLIRTPGTPVTYQLFNMTDDQYETTDLLLGASASSYTTIVNTLTADITGIVAENYPPYIGPHGITQTVAAGGTITLYAPFSSYKAPTVQWRKNGTNISTASPFFQVTNGVTPVNGVYMATLTLSNVTGADAANYDVTVSSTSGSATSPAGTLTVVISPPVLDALPTFSAGTTRTVSWPSVTGATSYTLQIAGTPDFTSPLGSQTVTSPSATFAGLGNGLLYYYRATASSGPVTSGYSSIVSSTQDSVAPVVAMTSPVPGVSYSTTHATAIIQGTVSDTPSGVASVSINGVAATLSNGNTQWSATVPLSLGSNVLNVIATDNATNTSTTSVTIARAASTQNDGLPDSWKTAHGININSNAPADGPLGDPDHDGLPNLLEYAFNTEPQSFSATPTNAAIAIKQADGQSYVEFSYFRRIGALDLTYRVEVTDDLDTLPFAAATSELVSTVPNGDGVTETVKVRILPSVNSAFRKFARVRVQLQ